MSAIFELLEEANLDGFLKASEWRVRGMGTSDVAVKTVEDLYALF